MEKTGYHDLRFEKSLIFLQDALAEFGTRKSAEQVLSLIVEQPMMRENVPDFTAGEGPLRWKPRDRKPGLCRAIAPYFDQQSIPLLKEKLAETDNGLRAYLVSQLTRLGYQWTDEQLQLLADDENWQVGLNALFAFDVELLKEAAGNDDHTIRVIAKLLAQRKESR